LRNKFIIGASLDTSTSNSSGLTKAHTDIETSNTGTYNVTGGTKDAVVVSHIHGITDPGHQHYMIEGMGIVYGGNDWFARDGGLGGPYPRTNKTTTGISINSEGQSGTNKNLPPYYALAFIMRVS